MLMQKADIAISAGGFTLYELCACGTPTITYCMADNQMRKTVDGMGTVCVAEELVHGS